MVFIKQVLGRAFWLKPGWPPCNASWCPRSGIEMLCAWVVFSIPSEGGIESERDALMVLVALLPLTIAKSVKSLCGTV